MKKFLAMLMAVMMVLSLVTVPVMAETPAANDPRLSTAPKTGTAAAPADAANLRAKGSGYAAAHQRQYAHVFPGRH